MRILFYELNEVPWKVIDYYLANRPNSNLAMLLDQSHSLTTRSVDEGELHPWSTWPTIHRGVSNQKHGIKYLNQDLSVADTWPPIWEILTDNKIETGVFGSLQSYPPKTSVHNKFYIPDTFAAKPKTHPEQYEAFQRFNLAQTGANKAVSSKISASDFQQALALLRTGVQLKTLTKVSIHVLNELINPLFKSRRAILQPLLAFDVFLNCIKADQPAYVSFYSNHVAGIMHRFWKYSFPEDFDESEPTGKKAEFHGQSIIKAMDVFDEQLGRLLVIAKRYDYKIVVCSSMGQQAIDRGDYQPELGLANFEQLKLAVGFDGEVKLNLAMQPDVAFEFKDEITLKRFEQQLSRVTDTDGKQLLPEGYPAVGLTLNRKLVSTSALVDNQQIKIGDQLMQLSDVGLKLFERDQGTGYHQPDGILIWQSESNSIDDSRRLVDSRQVLPTLLAEYGVPIDEYMKDPIEFEKLPHRELAEA